MSGSVVTEIIVKARVEGGPEAEARMRMLQRASDQYTAALDKRAAAEKAAAEAGTAGTMRLAETGRAYSAAAAAADRYLGRLSPAISATTQLTAEVGKVEQAMKGLDRQLATGAISAGAYNERMALLTTRHGEVTAALAGVTSGAIPTTKALEALSTQAERQLSPAFRGVTQTGSAASSMMRQFGIQSFDVFSSLSAGAPVMTVFIQQGAQIAQVAAAQGGAFAALGQVARTAFSAMVSPIGLAVTALAAFGAAGAVVASKSNQIADETRALSTSIAAVGRNADLSAKSLQSYVSELSKAGVAREDANAIAGTLARSRLSQGAIGQVAALVPDTAVALGVDAKAAADQLTEAARGSYDAIKKLDDALGFLSVSERDHIRRLTEQGKSADAAGEAFSRLGDRVNGLREGSLTPMERSFEALSNGWSDFITRVANSGPAVAVMERLSQAAANIGAALANESPADLTIRLTQAQGRALEARRLVQDRRAGGFSGGVLAADQQQLRAAEAEVAAIQRRLDAMTAARPAAASTAPGEVFGPTQTASDRSANTLNEMTAALTRQNEVLKAAPALREAVRARQEAMTAGIKAGLTETDAATYAQRAYDTALAQSASKIEAYQGKQAQAVAEEIAGLKRLTAARDQSGIAAAEAQNEVEQATLGLRQSLSDPSNAVHAAAIKQEIADLERLIPLRRQLRGIDAVNQATIGASDEADAQERIFRAYSGTADSILRATNQNKAYATVLKSMRPDQEGFADAVGRYAAELNRSSDAAASLQHAQQSVEAVTNTLGNAFDRLGQGLVDAFVAGQGAAVNFGSIARAIAASVLSDFAKLALINPVRNAVFGGSAATIGAAYSAISGGAGGSASGGGSSILGHASNLSSLAGLSDALGITSIKETLLGWGNSLGITGGNGVFSGVQSLLGTTLWGGSAGIEAASAANILAATGPGGLLSEAAVAGNMGISSSLGSAGTTLGGLLGGVGAGFGLGSLGGGLLQGAMGKTGPAPTIGAGVGALAGTLIGGPIGGILGGLLGGGAGGLIGPQKASSFSSTGLGISATGGLDIGQTVSQIADTTAELAQLQQQVGQINALLAASGAVITSLGGVSQIGQNTPGGFADPSKAAGIDAAFSGLRFSAPGNDTLNRAISGRSFGAVADLQGVIQEVTTFVDQTVPALKKLGEPASFGIGSLGTALDALQAQFDAAASTANRLGYAVDELATANDNARRSVEDAAYKQLSAANDDTRVRIAAGLAQLSGSASDALAASLQAFDLAAVRERETARSNLLGTFGDAYEATQGYADQIALVETALSVDRQNIIKQGNERIVAAEQQAANDRAAAQRAGEASALSTVTSISDWLRRSAQADNSPLSDQSKLALARQDFNAALSAAQGGDFRSLTNITSLADTLTTASRAVNGSGYAFAQEFADIRVKLATLASQAPEQLVAQAVTSGAQKTVAALMSVIETLQRNNAELLAEMRQQANRPARAAA